MGQCNCADSKEEQARIEIQTRNTDQIAKDPKFANKLLNSPLEEDPTLFSNSNKSTTGYYDSSAPRQDARKLDSIPDYSNPYTQETIRKLGPFVYDMDTPEYQKLPELGPYELDNSSVYIGQWKDSIRHSKGK